jgi:hypothetical protein
MRLFSHWRIYSGTSIAVYSPRALSRRSPGFLPCRCVTRCCLRPRGVDGCSSFAHPPLLPATYAIVSAYPHIFAFLGAMVQIQGIHPSPRYTHSSSFGYPSGLQVFGRLTMPYPRGLLLPPQPGLIARSPAYSDVSWRWFAGLLPFSESFQARTTVSDCR